MAQCTCSQYSMSSVAGKLIISIPFDNFRHISKVDAYTSRQFVISGQIIECFSSRQSSSDFGNVARYFLEAFCGFAFPMLPPENTGIFNLSLAQMNAFYQSR